jgi:DNA-binding beta-propeller fold protein YncE
MNLEEIMFKRMLIGFAAFAVVLSSTLLILAQASPYHALTEIKLGGAGQWDYLNVDEVGRRLYVAHSQQVEVIDIDTNKAVGVIANTPGVHGFAPAPDLGKGFSSNGRGNNVSVVDLKTLMTTSQVMTGGNPDWIFYEPKSGEVYTCNGAATANNSTVFNAKTGAVIATIALGGKPETAVADAAAGRVYINIEDKDTIAVVDMKTHAVVATWPIAPAEGATGLAIDLKNHRLFAGAAMGRGAGVIVVMDSTNGKIVATMPAGAGIDATAFDPGTGYAYASSGGSGTVTIIKGDTPDKYSLVQTLTTAPNARTMGLDPKTHNIYLAATEAVPGQRGGAPNSFKIMVFGTGK